MVIVVYQWRSMGRVDLFLRIKQSPTIFRRTFIAFMTKTIGTHSGSFHADESLACYMLRQTKEFAGARVVRSRDPKVLADCEILVDVGAVYGNSYIVIFI